MSRRGMISVASLSLGIALLATSCQKDESTITEPERQTSVDIWKQKADFAGQPRSGAVGFAIGSKGYIGTGDGGVDFWEYDALTNRWTQKSDFGGSGRALAVGFSIGDKGFVGTGTDAFGNRMRDFWEYDPLTNRWTEKSSFGGTARSGAVGFSIGNMGYIGTGILQSRYWVRDFWEYDQSTDRWTRKANFAGTARHGGVGFSIGKRGYVGTGRDGNSIDNNRRDFWEYDPDLDVWTQKADFGGSGRFNAVGFSISTKGYLGTGAVFTPPFTAFNDFWEYDPRRDHWIQKSDFGGSARELAVGFSIGGEGYIGTGYAPVSPHDFWQYTK